MSRRVVVTGMGMVVPGAAGKLQLWGLLTGGESAVRRLARFDPVTHPWAMGGEVANFDPRDYMDRKVSRRIDRYAQFSVGAAKMAVADAHLDFSGSDQSQTGVFEGTSLGPLHSTLESHECYLRGGCQNVGPSVLMSGMMGSGSGFIAMDLGIHGPSVTLSDGSASSAYAIGHGFRSVKEGALDIAIAGGSEAPISPEILATFHCARLLSLSSIRPQDAMKPFDCARDGFVLGEGAAYLVLEEMSHAVRRSAPVYGEIVGFGETTDAYHPTSPDPSGLWIARAMDLALQEAGLQPQDIQYLNAHGTATKINDIVETQAIKKVFGPHASKLSISSTKPLTGHLLGACGGLEAATTLLSLEHRFVPPTLNLAHPDTECGLDYTPGVGRERSIDAAMTNNYSFGGRNASLVFKRFAQNNPS